jgi:5-methylcytosine-specific restriction endonuclease McrA
MNWELFQPKDLWRSIILYGRNAATYKIALGRCLIGFAEQGKSHIVMQELAEAFFNIYLDRLKEGKPQLLLPGRQTVMEQIVALHNLGKLERGAAIERVEREAFGDVIPRFHTVNDLALPVKFYDHTPAGLIITDSLFNIFSQSDRQELIGELNSRWDLLEAAFIKRRENSDFINDIRSFYLERGYARTNITHVIPAIAGYQDNLCFYCGESLLDADIDVDHVIPRQVIHHDEVWNLVLAHRFCNNQKSDLLPGLAYIEKLVVRNERLIASNHPLRENFIGKLGVKAAQRRTYILEAYKDAERVLGNTWEGVRGYNPANDQFYKSFVRNIIRL